MTNFDERDGQPLFMAMSNDNASLSAAIQRAKGSIQHFKAALRKPEYEGASFLVKGRFTDQGTEDVAHLWLGVHDILEDIFFCSTFEVPEDFGGMESNQSYVMIEESIEDWMVNSNGRMYGGFTIRMQRELLPENERSSFDKYTGVTDYMEELP